MQGNRSSSWGRKAQWGIWGLIGLAFLFEIIRDVQRDGDFMGYVNAGNAVLNGTHIYLDYLNTWPPFFSIFSVPLALVHNVSPVLIRLVWLLGIIVSWYFIIRITSELYDETNVGQGKSFWLDWKIMLPFLFTLRFVIDDISNIQINTYLLLSCLLIIRWHFNARWLWAGMLLGLIVSLKVYPVFLLLFFLWKKDFAIALTALATVLITVGLSFLVFGDSTLELYRQWVEDRMMGETIMTHKNQSVQPWLEGFFRHESRGLGICYNVIDLTPDSARNVARGILVLLGLYPAYRLRFKKEEISVSERFGEFAVVLACFPLLSPLAWKYYFVFLFPLYFVLYQRLFRNKGGSRKWKVLFFIALALSILSTDGLIGARFSDVMEVYGCVTVATLLLIAVYFGSGTSKKADIV